MKILGLSAFYHDSACALIDEGELLCAAQEERWTRKKHDSSFPVHSLRFCLDKIADLSLKKFSYQEALKQIDYIVYYDKPFLTFERILETYLDYAPLRGFESFKEAMPLWLSKKLNIRSLIKKELKKHFGLPKKSAPKILFNYHHLSHAASAFYPSPYEKAAILCVDGAGEWAAASAWLGDSESIQALWQIDFPHSLGLFYSAFTEYCGFKVNSGEYKLMGLAPYGEPKFMPLLKDHVIDIKEDGSFQLNQEYFNYAFSASQMINPALSRLLKKPARQINSEQQIDIHYMNVAASVQKIIEEALIKLCRTLYQELKVKNLCMAGGVALNCVANEKFLKETPFENFWAQPAAGDAGGSLGAAYSVWHDFLKKPRIVKQPDSMKGALLGPSFSSEETEKMLIKEKAVYKKYSEQDLIDQVIEELTSGKIIGWFQGAMEFGPRALGCRSILADPRLEEMQKKINLKIKFRESFRPFAISILEEKTADFFEDKYSPYMMLTSYILPEKRKNTVQTNSAEGLEKQNILKSPLPSCTHVDYSCRIQTVGQQAPIRFKKLLTAFYKKTNCPGLINTSFNVRGEPIVRSPYEAYRCFMNTDMALCVINNYILKKEEQKAPIKDSYRDDLEED